VGTELCRLIPSALPLEGACDFPTRLTKEDFGGHDIGPTLQANGAADYNSGNGALRCTGNDPATPLALDDGDLLARGRWHTGRLAREAVEGQRKGETNR
jgi:hypothetical protein